MAEEVAAHTPQPVAPHRVPHKAHLSPPAEHAPHTPTKSRPNKPRRRESISKIFSSTWLIYGHMRKIFNAFIAEAFHALKAFLRPNFQSQAFKQGWCFCRHSRMHSRLPPAFLALLFAQGLRHSIIAETQRSLHVSAVGCAKAVPDNNKNNTLRKTMGLLSIRRVCTVFC